MPHERRGVCPTPQLTIGLGAAPPGDDNQHSAQRNNGAGPVIMAELNAVNEAQPQQRGADIYSAVGGVNAPARRRVQGQQPDEHNQREPGGEQQQRRGAPL